MKLKLPIALLLVSVSSFASNQKEDPDLIYQQAVILYEQGQPSGLELMLKAADAGSTKALCTIARAYQGTSLINSDSADEYFTKAAELGGLCGMIALSGLGSGFQLNADLTENNGDKTWAEKAIEVAEERVKKNDIDAIKTYAYIRSTQDDDNGYCDWMEKAAELGDADAMKKLAGAIRDGCGWYLIPGSRDKAIRYWTEQAAKHGNPKSMEQMMTYAEKENNVDMLMEWLNKALDTGNVNSVMLYGEYMTGGEFISQQLPPEKRDAVKGYGAFYAITKQIAPNEEYFYYTGSVKRLAALDKTLSPEQIANAKKWAEEWMKTHQVRDYSLVFH